jgi:hypothetical protein
MGKKSGPGSRSGMNIPDHISEGFETIFGVKNLNYLMWIRNLFGPGSGMEKIRIWDPGKTSRIRKTV